MLKRTLKAPRQICGNSSVSLNAFLALWRLGMMLEGKDINVSKLPWIFHEKFQCHNANHIDIPIFSRSVNDLMVAVMLDLSSILPRDDL